MIRHAENHEYGDEGHGHSRIHDQGNDHPAGAFALNRLYQETGALV
jgi:hypothetical protein